MILIATMVPLALIAFWPTPVDQPIQGLLTRILRFLHRNGIPNWFSYRFVEASANIALFIPIGFISSLAFPKKAWWRIGAFGLLLSGTIELGQLLFLHDRFASPVDLVTNASGSVIGALLAIAARRKLQARCLPAADL
jgi:glycopeptide antibiotics resistance protein